MTRKKGPFTVKISMSVAPWMKEGIDKVGRQLDEGADGGWARKPYSSSDVIRYSVTEFLESRGIVDPDRTET